MPILSIVIPVKDEQDNVLPLLDEIHQAMRNQIDYEVVFVDDGSTDLTYARLAERRGVGDLRLRLIKNRQSLGQSTAIYLGVQAARGRLIATLDGDGQNDPADIHSLLALTTGYGSQEDFLIAGYRKHRRDSAWKKLQSLVANGIRARLLGDNTPDTGCGLKLFPRHSFLKLPYFDHMHRFLPALFRRLGGDIQICVVNHRARLAGISKYNMLNRAWVGLVDMLGVMWLQRRNRLPKSATEVTVEKPII